MKLFPRLVAVDLDGTLLRENSQVSERTVSALRALRKREIPVVISTGRSFEGLEPIQRLLGLEGPVICYNGAVILEGGTPLRHLRLPSELAKAVWKLSQKEGLHFQLFKEGRIFYEKEGEESDYYYRTTGLRGELSSFEGWRDMEATKCLVMAPPSGSDFSKLENLRVRLLKQWGGELNCTYSRPFYLEILHKEASKGTALREVCRQRRIPAEEVMAFGDAFNDLEMMEFAGMSVAMANAPEALRRHCRFVTEFTNERDGVAGFLEEFVLN